MRGCTRGVWYANRVATDGTIGLQSSVPLVSQPYLRRHGVGLVWVYEWDLALQSIEDPT